MKTAANNTSDNSKPRPLQFNAEGDDYPMAGNSEQYSEIYRELAELLGDGAVIKIWRNYSGMNVVFPRQLYSKAFVRQFIRENAGEMKPNEIARRVGLTERRVRQIIHDMKAEESQREKED